ncbi:alcohol dehydrogenase catalytic domain-containing protein [Thermoactinomyces intermedius]|jgi:alcohol dehydrogenase|uniref:Zinc-dependent alcohol dehydrogenase family protein n=1 Tax=Thermoactinomyces intermedius TaxID=2024 RepID=A0A8I1AB45_THEIN|nr:zinc-dependent alcohol dehydrogenase family protein [Thermoactinomyces intermedius]MBA4548823.1 alcohol dehydrogenase catalytic domain-containing protein [Thermoactinomyces intermedius]MBA4837173.1 alcohol dehydrogenase catalytic domain-containing protein [Thermoactinomyces intermedius]MBH8594701.1 zinc-dependent alcohol dehydrogenase family protein [Thermoactinomyces intermedius]
MKIRAAVLYEMNLPAPYKDSRPLRIETLDLDPPQMGEVLIRIRATGLCHSDLSVINGSRPRPIPMVLGHEAAGEVVEVGPGVNDIRPGDHVVCAFVPSCGHCLPCQEGRPALCEPGANANSVGTLLSGERRLHKDGTDIHHHLGISGFAEYAVVSRNSLIKVDPEIPFDEVALFGCAVMTGVGAVVNSARVPAGSSVAVVGLGGVGLCAILGALVAGARTIIAVDINPAKLKTALELGATAAFDARDPEVAEQIRAATDGGVEFAFETAGAVLAMQTAINITRRGGTTVTAGLPHPKHHLSFPQVLLAAEERTIKGSYVGSCVPARDIPRFIELYKKGRLPVNRLLTDRLRLEDINEGFDRLDRGNVSRLVVTM